MCNKLEYMWNMSSIEKMFFSPCFFGDKSKMRYGMDGGNVISGCSW